MKKLLAFAYELMNNMVLKGLGIMNCMMLLWVAVVCSLCFSGCGLAKGMRGVDEPVLDEAWVILLVILCLVEHGQFLLLSFSYCL